MTIVNLDQNGVQPTGEFGNANRLRGKFTLNTQAVAGIARPLKIPAGTIVDEVRVPHGAFGTNVTLSIGYEPVDAVDGPAASAAYFLAATAAATAGVLLANAFVPIRFEYDVYLTLTVGGATTTASDIDGNAIVECVSEGTR